MQSSKNHQHISYYLPYKSSLSIQLHKEHIEVGLLHYLLLFVCYDPVMMMRDDSWRWMGLVWDGGHWDLWCYCYTPGILLLQAYKLMDLTPCPITMVKYIGWADISSNRQCNDSVLLQLSHSSDIESFCFKLLCFFMI